MATSPEPPQLSLNGTYGFEAILVKCGSVTTGKTLSKTVDSLRHKVNPGGTKLTENELIGIAIRRVRERVGISGLEVERRAGLSKGTLSLIELGKRGPHWGTLRKIAKGIGVHVMVIMEEVEKIELMEAEG